MTDARGYEMQIRELEDRLKVIRRAYGVLDTSHTRLTEKLQNKVKAIEHMVAMCGIPDSDEACRTILKRGKEALSGDQ